MDPVAIANLIATLLPSMIGLYGEIQQQYSGQVKPLSEILTAADTNWDAVAAAAQAEVKKPVA